MFSFIFLFGSEHNSQIIRCCTREEWQSRQLFVRGGSKEEDINPHRRSTDLSRKSRRYHLRQRRQIRRLDSN